MKRMIAVLVGLIVVVVAITGVVLGAKSTSVPDETAQVLGVVPQQAGASTAGVPPMPRTAAQAGRSSEWEVIRARATADWEKASIDAVNRFSEEHELPSDEKQQVISALTTLHEDLEQIRTDIAEGTLLPQDGRLEIDTVRKTAKQSIYDVLGPEGAELLNEALMAHRGGGF